MGFRLSVQPILPIGKETLVYGSNDGGMNYQSINEEANKIMNAVGNHLYLKAHICRDKQEQAHLIVGPGDIEIHRGTDGNIYAIDVARLMPPDLNAKKPNSIFYQNFRPEFLKWYRKPLSSDAYSKFTSGDGDLDDKEAYIASKVLRENRIPKFASMIKPPEDKKPSFNWVTEEMKNRGINARFLAIKHPKSSI